MNRQNTPAFYKAGEHLRYKIMSPTSMWVFPIDSKSNSSQHLLSWFFDIGEGVKARGWLDRTKHKSRSRYRTYDCETVSHINRIALAIAFKV